ncbi:hypothetical protein AB6A40_003248 [Gnathostoma spinigerum]|uniref:Dolichol-phosphate mannosyltransferase subunit 3 n=1 Tax=Gnathostoma spinigerum TaxID=75299 RepID=A0ABD6EEI2_9BILA
MVSQLVKYSAQIAPLVLIWLVLLFKWLPGSANLIEENYTNILMLPVYIAVLFGIYAVCSVLYGVATFNECPQAGIELKAEIEEAKADLKRRGIIT